MIENYSELMLESQRYQLIIFLKRLESVYKELQNGLPKINFEGELPRKKYRFNKESENDIVAIYLKAVKVVSTLNACMSLHKSGYTQEIGVLCRVIEDLCNEILFLMKPGDGIDLSNDQKNFLSYFYQEEFSSLDDLINNHLDRSTLSSKKIRAAVARLTASIINISDAQTISKITHKTLSGYVHGAYPQIMELFGGNPPNFHLSGMLNTPRVYECIAQLIEYVNRFILLTCLIIKKMDYVKLDSIMLNIRNEFEAYFLTKSGLTPAEMLARARKAG